MAFETTDLDERKLQESCKAVCLQTVLLRVVFDTLRIFLFSIRHANPCSHRIKRHIIQAAEHYIRRSASSVSVRGHHARIAAYTRRRYAHFKTFKTCQILNILISHIDVSVKIPTVFYDFGSGTGKIVLQVGLQSACAMSKGVEFMASRHSIGISALQKLSAKFKSSEIDPHLRLTIRDALIKVHLIKGDCCSPDITLNDATVVFINNVAFQPDLMARIVERLASLPNLRLVNRFG